MFYQRPQSGCLILFFNLSVRWALIILIGLLDLFDDFSDRIYDIAKIHISAPFMIEGNADYFRHSLSNSHHCVILRETAHI